MRTLPIWFSYHQLCGKKGVTLYLLFPTNHHHHLVLKIIHISDFSLNKIPKGMRSSILPVLGPKWLGYRLAKLKFLQRRSSSDPTKELQILLLPTSTCWQICISLAIWFSSSLLRLTRLVRFISRVCCHHRGYEAGEKQEKGKKRTMNLRTNVIWKSISQKTEFPASLGGGGHEGETEPHSITHVCFILTMTLLHQPIKS